MSISTVFRDDVAQSVPRNTKRTSSKPFLLGIVISALIWAALGAVTTILFRVTCS